MGVENLINMSVIVFAEVEDMDLEVLVLIALSEAGVILRMGPFRWFSKNRLIV